MAQPPPPLPEGTLVGERFLIQALLGRGGFGITYLGFDSERKDQCVVKELAPSGSTRLDDGSLSYESIAPLEAQRLRHQFINEAQLLGKMNTRGVLPSRTSFSDFGTAYFVTDYVPNSMSLQKILLRDSRLSEDEALALFRNCLEILAVVHSFRILHRDIKPSNILVGEGGDVYLIDFGSAREWHSDVSLRHTIEHTPGYAPIEQLSEHARRGPGTDLYALCATMYEVLAGIPPPSATDRAAGVVLPPLMSVRSDVRSSLLNAIESGLALRLEHRPASCDELLQMLEGPEAVELPRPEFEVLDAQIVLLKRLRVGKRECPACRGILSQAVPLRAGACPVCREGAIKSRALNPRSCPNCRFGILKKVDNADPIKFCPCCRTGLLRTLTAFKNFRLLRFITCESCNDSFVRVREGLQRLSDAVTKSNDEWRVESERSDVVWICDSCRAQYDELFDTRREQIYPAPKPGAYKIMYADEWARVAAGLEPSVGNAECELCHADFFVDGGAITALSAPNDLHGFFENWGGQAIREYDLQWIGSGKSSGEAGLICSQCDIEFDGSELDQLKLVSTSNSVLRKRIGEILQLSDWHRIANELPIGAESDMLGTRLQIAVKRGYIEGTLAFNSAKPDQIWQGTATIVGAENILIGNGSTSVLVTNDDLQLGGGLKKTKLSLNDIEEIDFDESEDVLVLKFTGERCIEMIMEPVTLDVKLESGKLQIELDGKHLFKRLMRV